MTTLLITLLSLNSMQSQSKSIPSLETISIKSHVFERPINVLYQSGTTDQVVYITDGQKMIDNGAWAVIDSLIQENRKLDATYVFISTIDDVSGEDYREEYFFCNDISEKRIFFSTGKNDAEAYLEPLRLFTENKVKDIKVLTTDGAHDFQNWNGQIQMLVPFLLNVNNQ